MPHEIKTGVGRIVWGNPAVPQIKKQQDGPNKGQPILKDGQTVNQWVFGVAFPKEEFQRDIWPAMAAEAATGYPNGVPPRFAWKYDDGDGIDSNGKPFNTREGYAGCYILTISTEAYAPPIFKFNGTGYDQVPPEGIKRGDYVALGLKFVVNVATGTNTPSLYVNPQAIEFVGYGTAILGGVDPMALFGGARHALPPGASAAPVATPGAPGMPGMGAAPTPAPMTPPAPGGMPPAPGMGALPTPMAPLAAPMTPPPPPAPAGPARPTEPTHIHAAGTPQEQWFINGAWQPAATAPLPPPAPDFVANAGMPGSMPAAPGGMPGMMAPR